MEVNLLVLRVVVVAIVAVVAYIVLNAPVRSKNDLSEIVENDLVNPAIILGLVYIGEQVWMNFSNLHSKIEGGIFYFVILTLSYFSFTHRLIKPLVMKFITIGFIVLTVFALEKCVYFRFDVKHLSLEALIVFATVIIVVLYRRYLLRKKETSKENKFWQSYIDKLSNATCSLVAINNSDYHQFLSASGFRYFSEQLKALNNKNPSFEKKRFFIIKADDVKENEERDAINKNNELTDEQRIFKSLKNFHEISNIETYIVPESEVKSILKGSSFSIRDLDLLKLDNEIYKAREVSSEYEFNPLNNAELLDKVEQFITQYTNNKYRI